jgi:hypothetical protein
VIAPIRLPDTGTAETRRRLRRAHRLVASTLLPEQQPSPPPPGVPAWQAWMVAAWVVAAAACYFASMLGFWH